MGGQLVQKVGLCDGLTIPSFCLWLSRCLRRSVEDLYEEKKILTSLLNWSLDAKAAVPAANFPAFVRLADTPLMVKGSGSTMACVSVTPSMSIAEGGAITEPCRRVGER